VPRCPAHSTPGDATSGVMRFVFETDTWTCRGWDGEGCDHTVRNEDLELTYLGETGPFDFTADPGMPPGEALLRPHETRFTVSRDQAP
jgi:hypothetical protein